MLVAAGFEPALAALSTPCLFQWGCATVSEMAPVAGLAPTRTGLKDQALGSWNAIPATRGMRSAAGEETLPRHAVTGV